MKKLLSFSVFSVVSFLTLSPHTVHAEGILQGLTETIKSAAEIAKEAQGLKGPKKSDTSSSSWGGSSWGGSGSTWDMGTGTTATTPATGTATDPFADIGSLEVAPNLQTNDPKSPTGSGVEELKAKPDTPAATPTVDPPKSSDKSLTPAQQAAIKNFEETVKKVRGTVVKDPATGKPVSYNIPEKVKVSEQGATIQGLFQAAQQ